MLSTAPMPGFSNLALQSQAAFRTIMDAMARPGSIHRAPELLTAPAPMGPVAAMIALTLCDFDTPVWLDPGLSKSAELADYLAFQTGAPIVKSPEKADFAFISNPRKMSNLSDFAYGSDTYPDRSATLIIAVEALTNATGPVLSGPGIESVTRFAAAPLPETFWAMARANHALYPRGVDIIFCSPTELACLPRSTKISQGA